MKSYYVSQLLEKLTNFHLPGGKRCLHESRKEVQSLCSPAHLEQSLWAGEAALSPTVGSHPGLASVLQLRVLSVPSSPMEPHVSLWQGAYSVLKKTNVTSGPSS